MKKLILSILFAAAVGLFSACSPSRVKETAGDGEEAYHKITAGEARQMMEEGGVTVVDVRTEAEYQAGHIPDSILVPNETILDQPPEALPDQDAVLLIHCRTGIRSKQAADKLIAMGYTQIYDFGGIVDWPYDTVSE